MTSTVNPNIPATDADFLSAPIRGNFLATYNDINGIQVILSGLGNMAYQSQGAVTITGGNIAGSAINDGTITTSKIANNAITDTLMATGTANRLTGYDNSGNFSTISVGNGLSLSGGTLSASGGGSGTVTSVGISTDASWLTVSSSPITSSGTITLDLTDGQTQNYFLATPNGSTGKVSLRAIVATDIPTLNQNTSGQSGTVATISGLIAAGSNISLSGSGTSISPYTLSTGGSGGGGTVTTTGSPSSGNLTQFSGATSITNGDLSGDVTTNGGLATTVVATGGVSFAASATTNALNASNINAGSLALARIAAISNNSILGNVSGGSASPIGLNTSQLTALISFPNAAVSSVSNSDNSLTISPTTGNVIASIAAAGVSTAKIATNAVTYAKIQQASADTLLGNPTSGTANVEEITLGSGLSFAGTVLNTVNNGTVTSIATNNGLTGGTITTSGTVGLATVSNLKLLSNISGSTAVPVANTLTAVIDAAIGSSQGEILYRGSSVWSVLAAGTSGQVLATGGISANPQWSTISGTGTVTSVATDSTLTGGPITGTGTLGINLSNANTWTAAQTQKLIIDSNNAVTASAGAATVPSTYRLTTITNNAAASCAITITKVGATDGQLLLTRFYDASAAAKTLSWVNTENSTVSVPTTSNGSTTLPLTVGFQFNAATSNWRCIASA